MRQQRTEPAAIEAEIAQLRSLALDALRRRWRAVFGRTPPAAALGMKPAPCSFPHVCAWTCQISPQSCRRNMAPPPPKPRGGHAALAGERSTTTDARFAGKVQRKVSNGIAGLAAAGSSRHRQKIAAIPASASILPRSWH